MNRRNNRRNFYKDDMEANRIVVISAVVLIISILAFFITFFLYRNYLNKQTDIAQMKELEIAETQRIDNEESSKVSSSIGKTVNEMQEKTKTINEIKENTTEKIAINTSNIEKENVESENKQNTKKNISAESSNTNTINTANTVASASQDKTNNLKKQEKTADPTFKKPVEGEITVGFAKDTLIYSNTLQEWVTHNGIDIKAEKTTIVKASAEGTVKSIKNDPRYGITVVIEHVNEYSTVYSNLLTAEFIKEGEKVEQGQTIGTVGNTATFEIADDEHLHFEILKDGEYLNPELYLK